MSGCEEDIFLLRFLIESLHLYCTKFKQVFPGTGSLYITILLVAFLSLLVSSPILSYTIEEVRITLGGKVLQLFNTLH